MRHFTTLLDTIVTDSFDLFLCACCGNGFIESEMYLTFEKYVGNQGITNDSLNVFERTLPAFPHDHGGAWPCSPLMIA